MTTLWRDLTERAQSVLQEISGDDPHSSTSRFNSRCLGFFLNVFSHAKLHHRKSGGEKSTAVASKAMHAANAYQASGHLHESLLHYSKCLVYAPAKSPLVSMAYCNRAISLRLLTLYSEAFDDSHRVILAEPKMQDKDYWMTQALFTLVMCDLSHGTHQSRHIVQTTIELLRPMLQRQYLPSTLQGLASYLFHENIRAQGKLPYLENSCERPPTPSMQSQPKCSVPAQGPGVGTPESNQAAAKQVLLELTYNATYGRHFVAKQDIEPGTLLHEESALGLVLNPPAALLFCAYCLRRSHAPIPCSGCSQVMFCSAECQKEASVKFHELECRVRSKLVFPYDPLALRVLCTIGLPDARRFCTSGRPENAPTGDASFSPMDVLLAFTYGLPCAELSGEARFLVGMGVGALKQALYLEGVKWSGDIAQLLARLLEILPHNQLPVVVPVCNTVGSHDSREELCEIGRGLFPMASLFSHSCEANAFVCMNGSHLAIVSVCRITKGQRLTLNFGADILGINDMFGYPSNGLQIPLSRVSLCRCVFCAAKCKVRDLPTSYAKELSNSRVADVEFSLNKFVEGSSRQLTIPALKFTASTAQWATSHLRLLQDLRATHCMDFFHLVEQLKVYYAKQLGYGTACAGGLLSVPSAVERYFRMEPGLPPPQLQHHEPQDQATEITSELMMQQLPQQVAGLMLDDGTKQAETSTTRPQVEPEKCLEEPAREVLEAVLHEEPSGEKDEATEHQYDEDWLAAVQQGPSTSAQLAMRLQIQRRAQQLVEQMLRQNETKYQPTTTTQQLRSRHSTRTLCQTVDAKQKITAAMKQLQDATQQVVEALQIS